MSRNFLPRFRSEIERLGERAEAVIAQEGRFELRYVPFEHVNRNARLVFVGITPGMNQIALSYMALRSKLLSGVGTDRALTAAKTAGAFGGKQMRDRLNLMMRRFRIHEVIGATSPEEVWDESRGYLHATSVVPHAAFKSGKMFNGSFAEVLKTPLLRASFEQDLLPTFSELPSNARFVAIGPTPWNALIWCVENGYVSGHQVLGAFAHPSGNASSQVDYFVGKKRADEFTLGDPVLHRVPWLDRARAELERTVTDVLEERPMKSGTKHPRPMSTTRTDEPSSPKVAPHTRRDSLATVEASDPRNALHAVVQRGKAVGTILYPHVHKDGHYVVSPTRYEKDYIRVRSLEEVKEHLRRGFSVRMSNPNQANHRAPSLVAPSSVSGWR